MPRRSSYRTALTTSVTWVVRPTCGLVRWTRSPTPVRLGVKTSCPAARSGPRTLRKPCAPPHAPCTRTKIATSRPHPAERFRLTDAGDVTASAITCWPRCPARWARPETVGTGSYDESVTRERLLAWRLANQHLAAGRTADPARLVAHFGAVQAQEYGQALWAVGLRTT